MMNDTTNINLNDLPVTLEEDEAMLAMEQARLPHKEGWDNAAPETPALPIQDLALMSSLIHTFTKHIETLVDQRFAALVESHRTLALMDENMRDAITEMIDDKIGEHEYDKDHKNDADIETEVSNHVEYFLRQGDHQFITERNLSEKVSDVLEEILEDRVREVIDNASVTISI